MHYFGGKAKISKYITEVLNKELKTEQPFVDLFCGSCNIISKIDSNRLRIANDKHRYLIEMWKAIQNGWCPPGVVSLEEYNYIKEYRELNPALTGFVGFGCSYFGKWFGGYARDGKGKRNYADEAKRGIEKKLDNLHLVKFENKDYKDVEIPLGSLVYCDIPYEKKLGYCKKEVGEFNHDEFYKWVDDNKNKYDFYISEYKENIREGFEIVWEKESKTGVKRNGKNIDTVEVLIKPIKNETEN